MWISNFDDDFDAVDFVKYCFCPYFEFINRDGAAATVALAFLLRCSSNGEGILSCSRIVVERATR